MSIKHKYAAFVIVLHVILVVVLYNVLIEKRWIFLFSEGLVLLSLYMSYLLYKALIKPLDLMQSGLDAINDKDFSITYLKTGSTEIDKLVDVFNTMMSQLRTERISMSEQSYFIQQLMLVSPLGIILLKINGHIDLINDYGRQLLKVPQDFTSLSFSQLDHPLIKPISQLRPGQSEVISINGVGRYKCRKTEVIHQGFKRVFIVIDDLSNELLQSEKQAYGKIIRMMAHEVNNSIGAINSILDTIKVLDPNPDIVPSLDVVIDRNRNLSQFMDNYASILRLPSPDLKLIDLNLTMKKCGQLYLPRAHNHDISIEFRLSESPVMIQGDTVLLEQAISNIIKNAFEAIGTDGDIVIITKESSFEIWDNGIGITPETAQFLFTPFYSTKPTGQGVGLMLIRDILDGHKANFQLYSDTDGWTKFSVRF